ncbi:MAG TPA: GldG family protein, partial [Vicinamibacteria bacterium]
MKKIVDLLAPLGFVVVVGALAWERWGKTLPGGFRPWLIGGVALIVLHLLLRWEDVAGRLGRRQVKYGGNTLVVVLVVLGILGALNYLAARNSKKWDLTKNQRYSLSDQTKKVVSGLKDEVKITYFQRGRDMSRGQDRLKEYQDLSGKLKVEYVDPVVSPAKAQLADARGPWPILLVERGDKKEKITSDSEQDLTNALIKITREGKKTVCLATGEGERSAEDTADAGFSGAKAALTKSQYDVKDVLLLRE